MQQPQTSNWDKIVHVPFKKVVKFDLICMGIGIVMGTGIGTFIATNI